MNKNSRYMLILAVIVVLFVVPRMCSRSNYKLSPEPIQITSSAKPIPGGLFSLPYSLECVPGPTAKGSYYTKGLSPGGICGAQRYVMSQADDYKIIGGIGGSLLNEVS